MTIPEAMANFNNEYLIKLSSQFIITFCRFSIFQIKKTSIALKQRLKNHEKHLW
tara:strand:- start:709 stop:870 length:162 start_codon:yes stop_codon:yes gene_type:complete